MVCGAFACKGSRNTEMAAASRLFLADPIKVVLAMAVCRTKGRHCGGSGDGGADLVGLRMLATPQERRMSKFAIRLLTLAMYATALAVVPMATPTKAATNSGKQVKKHPRKIQRSPVFSNPWSAGQAWPVARPSGTAGAACPGNGRSFDCRVWPPPFEDDPDRRVSGTDGG